MSRRNYKMMKDPKLIGCAQNLEALDAEDRVKVATLMAARGLVIPDQVAATPGGMEPWMAPMLCQPGSVPAKALSGYTDHVAEVKFDGWRCAYHYTGSVLRMFNGRNGNEHSGQLPYLEELLAKMLPPDTCVDGELLSPLGHQAIASVMNRKVPHVPSAGLPALTLILFDVLRVEGIDVRNEPWETRRGRLEKIPVIDGTLVSLSLIVPVTEQALESVLELGFEGLVIKRRSSRYVNGRSSAWVKCKPQETCEARIVGFKPGEAGGRWDGKVGAFEIELLETGVRTTIKCGTDDRHEDATAHPERWDGEIIEIAHHGLGRTGVPRHPQYFRLRVDRKVVAA